MYPSACSPFYFPSLFEVIPAVLIGISWPWPLILPVMLCSISVRKEAMQRLFVGADYSVTSFQSWSLQKRAGSSTVPQDWFTLWWCQGALISYVMEAALLNTFIHLTLSSLVILCQCCIFIACRVPVFRLENRESRIWAMSVQGRWAKEKIPAPPDSFLEQMK